MIEMIETTLPFSGFYNSLWSDELDYCEKQQIEHMREDDEYPTLEDDEISDGLMRHMNYSKAQLAVCVAYVSAFEDLINEELEIDINLTFNEMTSPKEYNFTTDRIFAGITRDDLAKVYRKVGRKAVAEVAREMFTSRSGFISFYNPDITTWGPIREWDYNQIGTILMAATRLMNTGREGYDLTIYDGMNESIYNAYSESVDWKAFDRDLRHLCDVKNGEAEEDARRFPSGSILDTKLYIKRFDELNNLKGE